MLQLPVHRIQGNWEDDDYQRYKEYDDAYDDEWYDLDYNDESSGYEWSDGCGDRNTYNKRTDNPMSSAPSPG